MDIEMMNQLHLLGNTNQRDVGIVGGALLNAAKCGDLQEVYSLLQHNQEAIGFQDDRGWTAMHHAACGGHEACLELLMDRGNDKNF